MNVQIVYGASLSHLIAFPSQHPGLVETVRETLREYVDDAERTTAYLEHRWDGYHRGVSEGGAFPSGLLLNVIDICENLGYTCKIEKAPTLLPTPELPPHLYGRDPLTPKSKYWFQWADVVCPALDAKRGVLKVPTGGGKTNIAAMLLAVLKEKRAVFLVDQIELLQQAADDFRLRLQEPISCIGGGEEFDPTARICVATVQSLEEKVDKKSKAVVTPLWDKRTGTEISKWLSKVELLFADECHLATSDAFYAVIQAFKLATYRYGLSATPLLRGDLNTMLLREICGDVVVDIPARYLIDLGILAEPKITFVAYDGEDPPTTAGYASYSRGIESDIWRNARRNDAIRYLATTKDHVLILVANKTVHGPLLYNLIQRDNPHKSVQFLHGNVSPKKRKRERKKFKAGEIDIMIATQIFDKGVDLPIIENLILAGGGRSPHQIIQRLGRGMRVTHNKSYVYVYDFLDQRNPYVADHTAVRISTYEEEGYDLDVWIPTP